MKRIITIITTIMLSVMGITQTTYYVSLTGNNTNDGLTEATAWRTIGYAASAESPVTGGDIVYIKAGDYGLDDVFIDKNYSPDAARISFIGYKNTPGDITDLNFDYGDEPDASIMPLINPNDRTIGEGINLSDIYSITVKNIQISTSIGAVTIWNTTMANSNHILENLFIKNIGDGYSTAITMKESGGNTIRNCLIVNATGAGMDLWGDNNLIEDCKVYSDESELTEDGTYTSMDYYIVLKGDDSTVRNCYAERVGNLEDVGHGLEIKESGQNNLFIDCVSKNMIAGCFSVRWSGVQNNEFRNCRAIGTLEDVTAFLVRDGASHNTFNNCISENCPAGVRFLLSGEDADYCGEYNTFNNCIIKNAEWAFDLNSWYYSGANVDNNLFANCVIDNAANLFNCERPNQGNKLVNCIITNTNNFLIGDDPSNFEYLYCDFYNNGFAMPSGTGNIDENPLYVDAAAGDFHLTSVSPCIDAGTATDAPTWDYDGNQRPQGNGYDIGAFEYLSPDGVAVLQSTNIDIFPNPTTGKIYLPGKFENMEYEIISITGNFIKKGIVDSHQINLDNLTSGVYFLEIYDFESDEKYWERVVLE